MTFWLVARSADGAAWDGRLLGWAGWESYEERPAPGAVAPVVLSELREAVAPA